MKMGKWELVSGCGRELWLNPPPPSLWRLHRSLDGMRHSGTTQRAWHQTDSKTWYLIFLSRADTNSALHLLFSHACSERRSCAEKKRRKGKLAPAGRLPDVRAAPSLLIQIICGLFSWRRIKTFHLSELFLIERNPWPPSAFKLSRRNTIACACNCICQSPRECKTCGQAFSACMILHVCEWKGARGDTVAGSFAV